MKPLLSLIGCAVGMAILVGVAQRLDLVPVLPDAPAQSAAPIAPGSIGLPEGLILGFVAGLFVVYLLPTIIAAFRHKANVTAIALVNIFLGWSIVGWFIALVWALSVQTVDAVASAPTTIASKLCPFCAETIKAEAITCRYCQRDLPQIQNT